LNIFSDFFILFLKDKVLDIHFTSDGKSYLISDIEWFCHTINNLFNIEKHTHGKSEHILEQFKHRIGTNVHVIFKRDFKKLKIKGDEVCNHIQLFIFYLSFFYLRWISFNGYSIHGI